MTSDSMFYLGIGAPRCGTTWLYTNLRRNSDLYLPPVKELRYFAGRRSEKQRTTMIDKRLAGTLQDPRDAAFYHQWAKVRQGDPDAYRSLFPAEAKVGEISPIYCTLDSSQVAAVKTQFPDRGLRAFFMMRNPMDRDISHVIFALHFRENRTIPYTDAEYLAFVDELGFQKRSQYKQIHQIWQDALGDDLRCFYYNDLKAEPEAFFDRFCREMGVIRGTKKVGTHRVNPSGRNDKFAVTLPEVVIDRLRERNMRQIAQMDFLKPVWRKNWLRRIEQDYQHPA